jgi:hypothetical protein
MDGGSRFYKHNRQIGLLPEIKEYTKKNNDKQDSFLQFMEENEFEVCVDKVEYCKDLYYFYSDFVKNTSMSSVGKETFYKRFEDRLQITKLKNRDGNYYSIKRMD